MTESVNENPTNEGAAGADPSNTPVENLVAPLDDDTVAERVRGVDTTVVEHTPDGMVLRDAATQQREGGLGEDGEVLDGDDDRTDEEREAAAEDDDAEDAE